MFVILDCCQYILLLISSSRSTNAFSTQKDSVPLTSGHIGIRYDKFKYFWAWKYDMYQHLCYNASAVPLCPLNMHVILIPLWGSNEAFLSPLSYTQYFTLPNYPEESVPTGGVLAVTCFGLKINELPSCIARDIFRALFGDDLAICFRGRSLDTIERHLQQAVNAIQKWATMNGFKFAAHKCKVIRFTAPRSRVPRLPAINIGDTFLPVEESTKFLLPWGLIQ